MMSRARPGDYPMCSASSDMPTITREKQKEMSFANHIVTENLDTLRQRLLFHPLWTRIEQGTLPRETLRVFALQDWWLVPEAYRLDALAVAGMPGLALQHRRLARLMPEIGR